MSRKGLYKKGGNNIISNERRHDEKGKKLKREYYATQVIRANTVKDKRLGERTGGEVKKTEAEKKKMDVQEAQ